MKTTYRVLDLYALKKKLPAMQDYGIVSNILFLCFTIDFVKRSVNPIWNQFKSDGGVGWL